MWRREVHRDFFWVGLFVGLAIGGLLGVLLGSEAGRHARARLEQATQRVCSRLNGAAESHDPPAEAEPADSSDES